MEIVIAIVSKIAKYTVKPIGRQMDYLFFYDNNVEELKNQVEKLGDEKQRMQQSISEAERNGNEIFEDVKKWLINVDGITTEADKLADDASKAKPSCSNWSCLNLKSRHQLSRKAKKLAQVVSTIVGESRLLDERGVSFHAPPQGIGTVTIKGYEAFGSRNSTLNGVMEALKSDNVNKIGIYGMGGVGKTMLVKEVARQAKQDKLFDKVVMAVVSQTPNMREIQDKIAYVLDLKVDTGSTTSVRADQLHERLKKEKNILVIIDDIWEELNLEAVGISFGDDQKGCKLLFTSRNVDVLLSDLGNQKVFSLGVLSYDEARYLFGKIVGDLAERTDFHLVADEIVKECAGLPIAITTIANALKNRSLPAVWKDTVQQLRRSNPTNIKGVPEKVYSSIELSYNFLTSEEAKSLFLLCSLHKEDYDIEVNSLLRYGMGLDLFQEVYCLEEARNRVHTLVENLKSSSLLLDGDEDDTVKMHDVIRDVAIHIAAKDKHMFNVGNEVNMLEWSKQKKVKDSTAISLPFTNVCKLPERLECPQLTLFLLFSKNRSLQISHPFFEGMKELQVLHLIRMDSQFLSSSLSYLQNLQTLCLNSCELKNIASIGELKNLKVLDLSKSYIKELPKEIRQLTNLQSLDLSNCSQLEIIPANVLSNLKRLEELDMKDSFSRWEVERESTERSIAKVTELNQLSHLTRLKVRIPNAKFMPKAVIFEKLVRYHIIIGDFWGFGGIYKSSSKLSLELNASLQSEYLDAVKKLKSCEELYLRELKGVENILYKLNSDGFPCLKRLVVLENDEIQYIVNSTGLQCGVAFPVLESFYLNRMTNLEKICHGQLGVGSFHNLRIVEVEYCDNLKFVFSSSMARCFQQLQEMKITSCKGMGAIVTTEREDETEINDDTKDMMEFTQLHSLTLEHLPNLMCFCSDVDSNVLLNEKVLVPNLKKMVINGIDNMRMIWHNKLASDSFCKLNEIEVTACQNPMNIFPSNIQRRLQSLEALTVTNCELLEDVFEIGGTNVIETGDVVATQLRSLYLENLPKLESVWSMNLQGIILLTFQNLHTVTVGNCTSLKSLFPASVAKQLMQLESLNIFHCGVEDIIAKEEGLEIEPNKFVFPLLNSLSLRKLPELKSFYQGKHTSEWPSLKHLVIENCGKVKIFASNSLTFQETCEVGHHGVSFAQPLFLIEKKEDSQAHPFFQNLETLKVEECDKLKNLVLSSISFQNLTIMRIINCNNITEIVAKKGGEAGDDEILFTQLKTLRLHGLDSLTSFYLGNCNIKFPSLEEVIVKACPKLKIFSHGILSSPKLRMVRLAKIFIGYYDLQGDVVVAPKEELGEVDLNATVERFWEDNFNKSEEQSFTNQKAETSRDDNESETQDHV